MRMISQVERMCAETGFAAHETLTLHDLRKVMKTPEMYKYMEYFELTKDMTEHIFFHLSGNGATQVPLHFFLTICGKMKGAAKSADTLMVLYPLIELSEKLERFMSSCNRQLTDLDRRLSDRGTNGTLRSLVTRDDCNESEPPFSSL
eukprot:gnl/TRDRNA2_/TRDRNA2_153718_c1_seq1.p1 gnl/TRDRNA2_/TRDRNA2_153718_c1~~gnl/TRDRNA2_/TRDRNA2_153718_c1_seq1.p1  ORF type:complete len:147 (+),score=20.74 gnl/TRDRNA2_/TRDRNA2_153718_c1_seq1:17-457(+)